MPKKRNKKKTAFVWTHYLFDNDLNSLYFDLLFSYNNTIAGTNWWTNLFPLLRGTPLFAISSSLRYTFSLPYKWPINNYLYSLLLNQYVTLLQQIKCVLGNKEPMTTLASLENKPKKNGLGIKTRALPLSVVARHCTFWSRISRRGRFISQGVTSYSCSKSYITILLLY